MKRYAKIVPALSALFIVGTSMIAHAQDAKSMTGGNCLPLVPAGSTYNPWPSIGSSAINNHTADLTYFCAAVPRDNETTTTGLATATVSLRIQAARTVSCTLRSLSKFAASVDSALRTRTNPNAAVENYDMTFGNEVNVTENSGVYAMSCVLSPAARVLSYRWAEN